MGIIGAGRLGTTLAAALANAGYRVDVAKSTRQIAGVARSCDLVFLTVPDGAIAAVCESIPWEPRHRVVHCSGALGLDVLSAAAAAGASTGCFHPLQTFPAGEPEPGRFEGISAGVEAAEPLGSLLEQMAIALGGSPFRLEGVDRAMYHAAAVVASNLVVALASAATRLWALAGLPQETGREALSPLVLAAAHNISTLDLAAALTGPIARGDAATVERHLMALRADPGLAEIYRLLSAELLRLPLGHAPVVAARLRELLEP